MSASEEEEGNAGAVDSVVVMVVIAEVVVMVVIAAVAVMVVIAAVVVAVAVIVVVAEGITVVEASSGGGEEETNESWALIGSGGVSDGGASSSECNPSGFSGSRSVPLFGPGSMPIESHTML